MPNKAGEKIATSRDARCEMRDAIGNMRCETRGVIKHFTDLVVWQKAHELALLVYLLTGKFPNDERFGLTNQLRRAATSISANIAEGMGRKSYADRARFYYNARGSIYEVESYLVISKDLKHLDIDKFTKAMDILNSTRMLLNAFIAKTLKIGNESKSRGERCEV